MKSRPAKILALAMFIASCGVVTTSSQDPAKAGKPKNYLDYAAKFETVDYGQTDNSPNPDEARRSKSKRYDGQDWVYKITNPETAGVGKEDELPPPPQTPVNESDLIVVGRVKDATAHLSNDKGGVYTEFSICIKKTIRADPAIEGTQTDVCVTADREGGRVRYPNGQIVFYANSNKGIPWVGSEWLFFLRRDGKSPNYEVITAYQNDEGAIYPLDNYFRDLKGKSFSDLLTKVKQNISNKHLIKSP